MKAAVFGGSQPKTREGHRMSDAKKKVKAYMDEEIAVLEEGLDRLYACLLYTSRCV